MGRIDPDALERALLPPQTPSRDRWVWATVTQASPLQLHLDGDADPLPLDETDMDVLNGWPTLGDRVYCPQARRRLVVIGVRQ